MSERADETTRAVPPIRRGRQALWISRSRRALRAGCVAALVGMLSVSQAAPVPKKNRPAGKNAAAVAAYSMAGWAPTAAVLAASREPGLTVALSPAGAASAAAGGSAGTAGRSMSEVQAVFGKNAVEFYAPYLEALKEDPALQGRVVVSMTIEPTGKVSRVGLVSSELANDDLLLTVLRTVEGLNFGKKSVPPYLVSEYPISFVPR